MSAKKQSSLSQYWQPKKSNKEKKDNNNEAAPLKRRKSPNKNSMPLSNPNGTKHNVQHKVQYTKQNPTVNLVNDHGLNQMRTLIQLINLICIHNSYYIISLCIKTIRKIQDHGRNKKEIIITGRKRE